MEHGTDPLPSNCAPHAIVPEGDGTADHTLARDTATYLVPVRRPELLVFGIPLAEVKNLHALRAGVPYRPVGQDFPHRQRGEFHLEGSPCICHPPMGNHAKDKSRILAVDAKQPQASSSCT